MKNKDGMDKELEKKVEGLSRTQIELLADILAGMAERLARKRTAESLSKWKRRDDYRRN